VKDGAAEGLPEDGSAKGAADVDVDVLMGDSAGICGLSAEKGDGDTGASVGSVSMSCGRTTHPHNTVTPTGTTQRTPEQWKVGETGS
jgi:hypothetical protein